jgi:hypothetical protein
VLHAAADELAADVDHAVGAVDVALLERHQLGRPQPERWSRWNLVGCALRDPGSCFRRS